MRRIRNVLLKKFKYMPSNNVTVVSFCVPAADTPISASFNAQDTVKVYNMLYTCTMLYLIVFALNLCKGAV